MHNSITRKIIPLAELQKKLAVWRLKSDKIVFTNGVFDLVHPGHVDYLFKAASLGNRLIIGLNSDASVRTLEKGDDRPINSEESRAMILAAFTAVDAVVIFDDTTPFQLISDIQPDVLVKGGDYNPTETDSHAPGYIVGSDIVRKNYGEVTVIPFLEGYSSTRIIEKIRNHGQG